LGRRLYSERVSEQRYAVDQEALRQHLPTLPDAALEARHHGAALRHLLQPAAVPVWQEGRDVFTTSTMRYGEPQSADYLDLSPRRQVQAGAAWPVRGVSRRLPRKPIRRPGVRIDRRRYDEPASWKRCHEFGHVMQAMLFFSFSRRRDNQHSGTSVERDFVECAVADVRGVGQPDGSLVLMRPQKKSLHDCPMIAESLVRHSAAKKFGSGSIRRKLPSQIRHGLSGARSRGKSQQGRRLKLDRPMRLFAKLPPRSRLL